MMGFSYTWTAFSALQTRLCLNDLYLPVVLLFKFESWPRAYKIKIDCVDRVQYCRMEGGGVQVQVLIWRLKSQSNCAVFKLKCWLGHFNKCGMACKFPRLGLERNQHKGRVNPYPALVQLMACRTGDKPLPETMMSPDTDSTHTFYIKYHIVLTNIYVSHGHERYTFSRLPIW